MKRTPLRRVGKTGRQRQVGMTAARKAIMPCVCIRCGYNAATDLHHVLPRSRGGTEHRTNLLPLCHVCHRWVHAHPEASYDQGFLERTSR